MSDKNLFSIGDVARLFHISVSSLRHYEEVGLLCPAYVNPESGYRYYGPEQFEALNTIRYLRALDMPLSDIRDFLQNREIDRIEEKLRRQREAVIRKQRELKRMERKIDHRLHWLADARREALDRICPVQLPPCRIVWIENPLKIEGYQDMEAPIRKLDRQTGEAIVFLGKVGVGISADHLAEEKFGQYDGVFLTLDQEDAYEGRTVTLPETLAVRIRFCGSHTEAPAQYKKLLDYIKQHSMKIIGFSRKITLIDYGVTNDPDQFVTEICIPVQSIR